MDEKDIRLAAADLIIGRGVRFKLAGAPFLWRLFRLNKITIRAMKLGTIVEIAHIVMDAKLDENATRQHLMGQMYQVCLCVAIAMVNDRKRIRWFAPRLAKLLIWKLPVDTILNVFYYVQNVDKMLDFTNITNWLAAHATMMSPKLGRTERGS